MTKIINNSLTQTKAQQSFRQETNVVSFSSALTSPYKNLAFPLNVYAHALLLQQGEAAYLHYGLFQHDEADLPTAQQFSTDLLLSRLPPPACRILEVGIGLGKTFSLLTRLGYQVESITPDAQQVFHVHERLGEQTAVSCQRLEDFETAAKSFDVMLFQESAQTIEPLAIFNKALDLLSPAGSILIIDEFALKHAETEIEALHLLDDLVALADRFGFELVERLDLTAMATPTLDYWLRMTASHRQRLIKDLALSDEKLTELDASHKSLQKKYVHKQYAYGLLHFRKKMPPKWRLQPMQKNRASEMLALFEKTFNHSMTSATWQWKYAAELSHAIGIWRKNQLIAHYGGISRKILLFGQAETAVQIGDVMVDAAERGILTKKGPFFLMAATFLEHYIGYGKPYRVGFGFPNERAMKVAEKHGLYAEVGRMSEFSWKPLAKLPRWETRLHLIDRKKNDWAVTAVDECWRQMAMDLREAVVGVRDWRYLQHRYHNHPNQHYQIVLVKNRIGKQARGVLVMRHDPDGYEIIDIVSPLAEIPLLIIHARRLAGMAGHKRVFCRITESFAAHFAVAGGVQQALNIRIPANVWSNGPSPEMLKNRWWLMSGDTDFK